MGDSLTQIAQKLKDADKKVQLIYAFNGTGKTRLSREFKELIAPKNPEDELWKDKPSIKKSLKELKLFQIRQVNSLFISGMTNLSIDDFSKLTQICSIISLRYNVIGGLNPNAQEDVYNTVALKIAEKKKFSVSDFQEIYISDLNFENDFSTKEFKSTSRNHKIVKYLLAKIELYRFHNEIEPESDLYTIEHILPENASDTWGDFSFDEINRSIYRIGNLTLLEKKLNKEADQKPFSEKKGIYSKSNCESTKAITEHFDTWNEDKLAARQKELSKHAKSIWRIQELSN